MKRIINILSFAFSLLAFASSAYAISSHPGTNIPSFVLSLVGICATLIVGISVVDTFVLRNALNKVDEKMEEQTKRMEELSTLEKEFRQTKRQINVLFHHTWGLALTDKQPYAAFQEFWRGFTLSAQQNDIKRAQSCLSNAEILVEDIVRRKQEGQVLDTPCMTMLDMVISDNLKSSQVYTAFGDRVERLLEELKRTIECVKN